MKKILLVFGTRPDAIKMCPLVKELKTRKNADVKVCVTGQHREMLQSVLDVFHVVPDYDLAVMKENQTLFDLTFSVLSHLKDVLEKEKPDVVLVHGDTTTAFVASLAAFYLHIPVGHVEAGLRTYDLEAPFPEEYNRRAVSLVAKYNFAPTEQAKENLLKEGKQEDSVFVVGNTAIDALKTTVQQDFTHPILDWARKSRLLFITAHRRENLGKPLKEMLSAILQVVESNPDVKAVYPVHLNPAVQKTAKEVLGNCDRVKLIPPIDAIECHNLMAHSYLVLTDSGGIQEEAPALGKPVLVMRNVTERPEGVKAGTLKLVGTEKRTIVKELTRLLEDENAYAEMAHASNPYGDGTTSKQIADILLK